MLKTLTQTFNREAIHQNIKPVADFFRMYGDETGTTYSNTLIELLGVVMKAEQDSPGILQGIETDDLIFQLKELNTLINSLKNPVEFIGV